MLLRSIMKYSQVFISKTKIQRLLIPFWNRLQRYDYSAKWQNIFSFAAQKKRSHDSSAIVFYVYRKLFVVIEKNTFPVASGFGRLLGDRLDAESTESIVKCRLVVREQHEAVA